MSNRYLALKGKDKFDISKVTVVGSPTISDEGVASGFAVGSYVNVPVLDLTSGDFEIETTFDYVQKSGIQVLFRCATNNYAGTIGFMIHIQNNNTLYLSGSDETARALLTLTNGTHTIKLVVKDKIANVYLDGELIITTAFSKELTTGYLSLGYGAETTLFIGSIDLKEFKIYVDNKLVYSPTIPTCLLERRKPKIWNKGQFTIVGNPSISESGVASGFGNGVGVEIPHAITSNKFTIEGEFTFGSNLTTFQWGCDVFSPAINRYLISIRPISDNDLAVCYWNGTGTEVVYYSQTEVPRIANKSYKYKIEIDGTTAKSTINGITKTTNKFVFSDVTKIILGNNYNVGGLFHGSIDLKQFKIYTDNNLVFDGGAETYVYDPSKFTVVGSPTITEYGVASGFSTSNYIKIPNTGLHNSNKWEIKLKFTTDTIKTRYLLSSGLNDVNFSLGIWSENNATGFLFCWLAPEMHYNVPISVLTILPNTTYFVIYKFNGSSFTVDFSYDDITYTNCLSLVNLTNTMTSSPTVFGIGNNSDRNFIGSIDLSSFSITVDGKEVFTGAKEVFYALRM